MKKRLIAIATLAALPVMSFAGEGASVSGFADITYSANNDKSEFGATGEVDVVNKSDNVSVRVDIDFSIAGTSKLMDADKDGFNDTSVNTAVIEQAFFAYTAAKNITVIGGVFNNPIGLEKEDAPDMPATTKGQIWNILDGQTALNGNNIAGVAVAAAVGPATITAAALNDIGHNDLEKNSFALVANVSPVKGLDLELGYVSQVSNDDFDGSAGNVMDVNAVYSIAGATVSFEYLTADALVDSAMEVGLGYAITDKINGYFRYDTVSGDIAGTDDDTTMTLYGSYQLAPNLLVAAEYHVTSAGDGADDDPAVGLEFIATF